MRISLEQFIKENTNKIIDIPWGNGALAGQCVSLVQQYLGQCLGQPMKARGNAKDWFETYPKEELGSIVSTPQKGDILVYGSATGNGYGHIAIYVSKNQMFDQNNSTHNDRRAGISKIFNGYSVLRPNVELIEEVVDVPVVNTDSINTYIVSAGDTLSAIASKYGTTYQTLAEYNGISNPNIIYVGQVIKIPSSSQSSSNSPISYTVSAGDTLSAIATKYGTTWQKIYNDNKSTIGANPNLIYIGQQLIINK